MVLVKWTGQIFNFVSGIAGVPENYPCQSCNTFPLNTTVAQLSLSFFKTKTMLPGRTWSSSSVSGVNSYKTLWGSPWKALKSKATYNNKTIVLRWSIIKIHKLNETTKAQRSTRRDECKKTPQKHYARDWTLWQGYHNFMLNFMCMGCPGIDSIAMGVWS